MLETTRNYFSYMKLLTAVKGCTGPKSNGSPGFHYLGRIGPKLGHIEPVCLVVVRVRGEKKIDTLEEEFSYRHSSRQQIHLLISSLYTSSSRHLCNHLNTLLRWRNSKTHLVPTPRPATSLTRRNNHFRTRIQPKGILKRERQIARGIARSASHIDEST
jgi:hypothetical protein